MLDAFPLFTRIMMISITVLECFLAIMLLRWDAWKRYPVMSAYVTWQAVGGSAVLLIACLGRPVTMPYFVAFYVVTFLGNVIAFAQEAAEFDRLSPLNCICWASWLRRELIQVLGVIRTDSHEFVLSDFCSRNRERPIDIATPLRLIT